MKFSNILFLDQYAHIGGGQRSLLALIGVFAGRKNRITVLAPAGGDFQKELEKVYREDLAFRDLPEAQLTKRSKSWQDLVSYAFYCLRVLPAIFAAMKKAEVVCCNGPRLFLPVFFISLLLQRRTIYFVRLDHSGMEKKLISVIARSASTHRVIANSDFTAAGLKKYDPRIGTCGRLRVVRNCIYPPFDSLPFKDRFAGENRGWNFGLFGRVSPEKGHDILPVLAAAFPESHFYIVGGCLPEEEKFLETVLQAAPRQIHFEGFASDLPAVVDRLGIQVSLVPSVWEESFGLVAVESMAMSCLTIVSRRGGLTDIAATTGCGSFNGAEECVHLLEKLGERGRTELAGDCRNQYEKARQIFSMKKFEEEVVDVFQN